MTDTPFIQEPQQEQTTVTIDDVIGSNTRAKRGKTERQPKEQTETKKKEPARSTTLKGKDIEELFEYGSATAVSFGAQPFWYIPGAEVKPFSDELAALLNRIPAHYVTGFFSLSGYLIVAKGMYDVFGKRLQMQREYDKIQKNGKVEAEQLDLSFTA